MFEWLNFTTTETIRTLDAVGIISSSPVATGLFEWLNGLAGETLDIIQVIGIVSAIAFVVYTAISTKMQFGKVLMSLLVAMVFIWGLLNIDWLTGRAENSAEATPGDGIDPDTFTDNN